MSEASKRSIVVERTSTGQFTATNPRGGTVRFGTDGGDAFTPVELLLAAIGGLLAAEPAVGDDGDDPALRRLPRRE
ncbi:hypothetical protein ABZ476_29850, partial [Streptomyces albogriseolus]